MYHLTVCVCACAYMCVSTHTCTHMLVCVYTHVVESTWDNKGCGDLHHALTCFTATMCLVRMSQQPLPPPLSSPYPSNTTVRTPHPLDSQTWTHPIHRLTSNQITPFHYVNGLQYWLLNMVNCHFSKLYGCVYLHISARAWLRIKIQHDKLHETNLSVPA